MGGVYAGVTGAGPSAPKNPFLRVTLPLAGVNLLNQAARMVMAVVGPALALEFGLSASGLGAMAAVFFAAYALAQLPLGLALDLHGARRVQTVMALVAAAGLAGCALAESALALGVARFVTGLGIAGALIAILQANRLWFAPHRLAATTGLAVFIGSGGALLATVPVQLVLPWIGWRGVFWALAGAACLVSGWIWLSVPPRVPTGAPRRLGREAAEFGRILRHPEFVRAVPAVAMLSALTFSYQGLWAGPWLRDVAGLAAGPAAGVLLAFAAGMMLGNLLSGQAASALQHRGRDPMLTPVVGMVGMLAVQGVLMTGPGDAGWLAAIWFGFGFFGSCGPAAYSVLAQRFPPALTGRVATAINATMLALVFALQNGIGWVLDQFARTASGGWDPRGYAWALGATMAMQALTVLWLARGRG